MPLRSHGRSSTVTKPPRFRRLPTASRTALTTSDRAGRRSPREIEEKGSGVFFRRHVSKKKTPDPFFALQIQPAGARTETLDLHAGKVGHRQQQVRRWLVFLRDDVTI